MCLAHPLTRAVLLAGVLAAGLSGCATGEPAEQELFEATLEGRQAIPAATTPASGHASLHYGMRSQLLRWEIRHSGLAGPIAGGHIHGPAGPGQVAGIVIPLSGRLDAQTIRGQLRLSPEQFEQLRSGQWYVDLHTARHPEGELRGQLRPSPR